MKSLILIYKKLVWCLVLAMLSSCAIPSYYDLKNIEGADMSCLVPKQDMLIYMPYNICPMLSELPTPKEKYWKAEHFNQRFSKENIAQYSNVNAQKVCNEKSNTMHIFLLKTNDKIYVNEMSTRTDTVRSNRLFFYGKVKKEEKILDIYGEIKGNNLKSIKKRILNTYNLCEH